MSAEKMKDETRREKRSLEILDKREVDELQRTIDKNFGGGFRLRDYGVMLGSEERVWLAARDVFEFDFSKLPANSIGLNFGKMKRNEKMRLTIEGSQLVGATADRNVAVVADGNAERFLRGEDIDARNSDSCEEHNFVIVKTESGRILGSAMFAEGKLENFLPKSRRIV